MLNFKKIPKPKFPNQEKYSPRSFTKLLEVSDQDIIELWVKFQTRAADLVQKVKKLPIILWTSALTSHKNVTKYLPPSEYIIQFWDKLHSKSLTNLINKGYKVIVSNYDALYLDCGYANWVKNGTNWCSPYKGEFKYIFDIICPLIKSVNNLLFNFIKFKLAY